MEIGFTKLARNFSVDRHGSPALEFAFIAPLFFAVLFGTFEVGRALYEHNRIAAAAAIASRTLVLDAAASDSEIQATITAKLANYDAVDLTITLSNETIANQNFKKIQISYNHEFIVKFGSYLSEITLSTTRYAPIT